MREVRRRIFTLAAIGVAALGLAACSKAPDQPAAAGEVRVEADHIGKPRRGAAVAAGYLTLTAGTADALIGVSSPAARAVEVHEMSMASGRMVMRPMARLDLPAGETVRLGPGGLHLMFIDLAPEFADAETVEVTLTFASAPPQTVLLPVKGR